MSNRSDVSPSRGRILDSLSQIFKKKDPEVKATPMMLGKDANFKYDPVRKQYIFLDEPLDEQVEEIKGPPKINTNKNPEVIQAAPSNIIPNAQNSLLAPPQNLAMQRRKDLGKASKKLAPIQVKLELTPQDHEDRKEQLTPELKAQINSPQQFPSIVANQIDQQTSPMTNYSGFWKENSQGPLNQKKDDLRKRSSSLQKDKDAQIQNQKEFEFFLVLNIANLSVQPKKFNQHEQFSNLISSLTHNWSTYHSKDDPIGEITHQSLIRDIVELQTCGETYVTNQNQFYYLKHYLSQVKEQEQMQLKQTQQLHAKQSQFYIQIIQEIQEEHSQQQNFLERLITEFNVQESVIASQNNLISEMVAKLNEFSTHCDNLKIQMDQLKEEKHLLVKQKQAMQSNLYEADIELRNSRKETEIYQKQLGSSQKEKDSYIKYYEELRKEMQEDIFNLNTRLEENLNMSTTENQATLIENSQLKQQLDIHSAENKLLESNYKNHIQLGLNYRKEIKNILENDLSIMGNLMGISTEFINLTSSENQCLEIRKVLFTLQKEITTSIKKRDYEHVKALDNLRGEIQSQSLKMNQMNNQLSNYQNQLNQYQKLIIDKRTQQSNSQLEREKQIMQMVKDNEAYKLQLKFLQSNVQTQQREMGSSQNDHLHMLNNLESTLSQDKKLSTQNNALLEQAIGQLKQYHDQKDIDSTLLVQLESEKRQLIVSLDQMTMERDSLLQELDQYKENQDMMTSKLTLSQEQISSQTRQIDEQKQSIQYSEQVLNELQLALQDLTQEYVEQRQNLQQLEQRLQESNEYADEYSNQIQMLEQQLQEKEEIIFNFTNLQTERLDADLVVQDYERIIQESINQITQLKELHQQLEERNQETQIKLENSIHNVNNLKDSESKLKETIVTLNGQIAQVESKLIDFEDLNKQLTNKVEELLSRGDLETQITEMKHQLDKAQELASNQQDSQENHKEKDKLLVELQEVLQQTGDELQDVTTKYQAYAVDIEVLKTNMNLLNQEIQFEQTRRQQIQEVLLKTQQENQDLICQLDELKEQWEVIDKENQNNSSKSQIMQSESNYETLIENQNQVIQELSDQLQELQNNTTQEELNTLKVLYAQKMKTIEKMKTELDGHQNQKLAMDDLLQDNESKEQSIVQLLREKKTLLRQIDQFQNQLDVDSLAQKNKELAQRIQDIEEERLMLKDNLEDIIKQSHEEVTKYKDELNESQGQLLQARAQRDEIKAQLNDNISKNELLNTKNQPQGGVLNKLATFFVTESEMKKINNQK